MKDFQKHVEELKKLKTSNKFEVETKEVKASDGTILKPSVLVEVDVPRMTTNNAFDLLTVMASTQDLSSEAQTITFMRLVSQVVMGWTEEIDYVTVTSIIALGNFIVEKEADFFEEMLGLNPKELEGSTGDSSLTTSDSN